MKLAQISRKLQVKPTILIAYIEQTFSTKINPTPNTEIPSQYHNDIIEHFMVKENRSLEMISQQVNDEEGSFEAESEDILDEIEELNVQDGVIRVPKVEMPGIKVVGKIDLYSEVESPDKSNMENPVSEDSDKIDEKEEQIVAKPTKEKKKKSSSKGKSRINKTLPYSEKKEDSEEKRELKKKKEAEKKKKRAYYEKMIREKAKTKVAKKQPVSKVQKKSTQKVLEKATIEKPKTTWKRFLYWLNN